MCKAYVEQNIFNSYGVLNIFVFSIYRATAGKALHTEYVKYILISNVYYNRGVISCLN